MLDIMTGLFMSREFQEKWSAEEQVNLISRALTGQGISNPNQFNHFVEIIRDAQNGTGDYSLETAVGFIIGEIKKTAAFAEYYGSAFVEYLNVTTHTARSDIEYDNQGRVISYHEIVTSSDSPLLTTERWVSEIKYDDFGNVLSQKELVHKFGMDPDGGPLPSEAEVRRMLTAWLNDMWTRYEHDPSSVTDYDRHIMNSFGRDGQPHPQNFFEGNPEDGRKNWWFELDKDIYDFFLEFGEADGVAENYLDEYGYDRPAQELDQW
jgi:hypothetical protein